MKTKDLLSLVFLAVVLIVLGSFLIGKLSPAQQTRTAQIEVVRPIDATFNDQARQILLGKDPKFTTQNFPVDLNLKAGFGNTNPFAE